MVHHSIRKIIRYTGTPCEAVVRDTRFVLAPEKVVLLFPRDPDLPSLEAVSYMGVPYNACQSQKYNPFVTIQPFLKWQNDLMAE